MRLIYVAGPYRAETIAGVVANIAVASAEALRILASGNYPVVPHRNTGLMDGAAPDGQFLAGARELMRRCDEVVVLPGWERSEGTCLEVEAALVCGLPVYDTSGAEVDAAPAGFFGRVRAARVAAEATESTR